MENTQNEVESNVVHAEPHDVRMARKIVGTPPRDPHAEESMERMLARGLIRYFDRLENRE